MKPCLVCGEPAEGSRCDAHAKKSAPGRGRRWTELSKRLRRRQRFCALCGATAAELADRGEGLEVDHIVPLMAGGAMYDEANLRVICGPCNRREQARWLWGSASAGDRLQRSFDKRRRLRNVNDGRKPTQD